MARALIGGALFVLACGGSTTESSLPPADAGAPQGSDASTATEAGVLSCGAQSCGTGHCCVTATATTVCSADPCADGEITCDDARQCASGEVCCLARQGGVETRCMPSCITNLPRTIVCQSDVECPDTGRCQAIACAGVPTWLRVCAPLDDCL